MFEYYHTKKHYHTLDYYLKTKYQKKVFKVPLNASFTCPNRDGTKSTGGCIFCSLKGSGDFAGNPQDSLLEQFDKVSQNIEKKWKDAYKIAYFQAYSNTYGPISKLKECFEQFIDKKDVIGLSIATRCDCINQEIVDYLKQLKTHFKEFWVELGLQSAKPSTMKQLNLCYSFKEFKDAVKTLAKADIDVVVHIIDGLVNETKQDQIETIKKINKLPIKGIKIHVLNIIENTKLGDIYKQKPFKILSEDEFVDIVSDQISYLKDDIIIHRLGADSKQEDLIAPDWARHKFSVVDKIDMNLDKNEIYQGDNYKS